jgi:murein DD-endopeptidase MepM/ murein hydrolase activator NlpD
MIRIGSRHARVAPKRTRKLAILSLAVMGCLGFSSILMTARADSLAQRQPGPFPAGMDTWYGSVYNTTAVHNGTLEVGGWGDQYDTLTRFDMSGLPLHANQAILWLYRLQDPATPTDMSWGILTEQWHSGTVGWATAPSGTTLGSLPAPTAVGWYPVDITSLYNGWRNPTRNSINFGLRFVPINTNNRFNIFASSGHASTLARPLLYVYYTPESTDTIPHALWPLATAYANRIVNLGFGKIWPAQSQNPDCSKLPYLHNGTDFQASAGTAVYAAEDGIIKESIFVNTWKYNIVLEHTSPNGGKYTTVYWHVDPVSDVLHSNPGGFVPKGMQIATVADLGKDTHFHFGIRIGAYDASASGTGALPRDTSCGGHPKFPGGFVDGNDSRNVIFQ